MADKHSVEGRTEERKDNVGRARARKDRTKRWVKPTLENVSGKVMAQPYIRFT